MNVIYPRTKTVFLAGTIDNGDSTNWQEELIDMCQYKDIIFFNPRRKEWVGDLSKEELELLNKYRALTDKEKDAVKSMINALFQK